MKHLKYVTTSVKLGAPIASEVDVHFWSAEFHTTIVQSLNRPLVELFIQTINSTLIYQQKHFQEFKYVTEERYES